MIFLRGLKFYIYHSRTDFEWLQEKQKLGLFLHYQLLRKTSGIKVTSGQIENSWKLCVLPLAETYARDLVSIILIFILLHLQQFVPDSLKTEFYLIYVWQLFFQCILNCVAGQLFSLTQRTASIKHSKSEEQIFQRNLQFWGLICILYTESPLLLKYFSSPFYRSKLYALK